MEKKTKLKKTTKAEKNKKGLNYIELQKMIKTLDEKIKKLEQDFDKF
jgi:predicted mannosyl-3-phosphoglycerate phosphatase (HAD superfamily)